MAPGEVTRRRSGGGAGPAREIPDKLYFRIGEVARLCEVPAYVLRFWESEFPQLKPNKGGTGQRLYRRRDVEMALRIKTLLYDEGYTIPGARQAFKAELRSSKEPQIGIEGVASPVDRRALLKLKKDLEDLHALLSKPAASRPGVQPIRAPQLAPTLAPVPPTPPDPLRFPRPKLAPTRAQTDELFADLFDPPPTG